ncbi:uncharacterized protein METZ01_LOCUS357189 [marine metagenome]|uniref:Uncharacterized protein n=1 Tax=marine metagenome TaxID=408172 RepID=A0A382S4C2_9ZZZZ
MANRHTRGGIITAFAGIGLILLGLALKNTPVLTGIGLLVTSIGLGIFVADHWLPQPLSPQEIGGIVSTFAGIGLTLLGLYLTPVLAGVGLLVGAIGAGIFVAFHFFPSKK